MEATLIVLMACTDSQTEEHFENPIESVHQTRSNKALLGESLFILFLRTVAGSKLRLAHLKKITFPRLTLSGLKVRGSKGSTR